MNDFAEAFRSNAAPFEAFLGAEPFSERGIRLDGFIDALGNTLAELLAMVADIIQFHRDARPWHEYAWPAAAQA
jgi:hypothetical protein